MAVADGQVSGEPIDFSGAPPPASEVEQFNRTIARTVELPHHLTYGVDEPPFFTCYAFQPTLSAKCIYETRPTSPGRTTVLSGLATYQPFVYAAPGLAMRPFSHPVRALRVGRLATASLSVALVAWAAILLWDGDDGDLALLGLVVALTPMAVYVFSTLTSSGLEIAAGVCFFSALLRFSRSSGRVRSGWACVGVSGTVLALSRTFGPVWVLLDVAVLVSMVGWRPSWRLFREGGRRALVAATAVVSASAACLAWQTAVQPRTAGTWSSVAGAFLPSLGELPVAFRRGIGVFGWLDSPMPRVAYIGWTLMLVVLITLGFLVAQRRQRWVLAAVVLGAVAVSTTYSAAFPYQIGQSGGIVLQGRWLLPIVVTVPLVAGELVWRNRDRFGALRPRWLGLLFATTAAAVHLLGWLSNGRRYAVGANGPIVFLRDAEWKPPLGWSPWTLVALAGALALVAFGALSCGGFASRAPRGLDPPVRLRRTHRARA